MPVDRDIAQKKVSNHHGPRLIVAMVSAQRGCRQGDPKSDMFMLCVEILAIMIRDKTF